MSAIQDYQDRAELFGRTKRDRLLKNTKDRYARKMKDSLSFHTVYINGQRQQVTIINEKESQSIKSIHSLPGETLKHGGIVDFANSKWLITSVDANNEVYTTGKMERCNHLLKWINHNGKIISKWCIVVDGTKYLIGEKNAQMMAIGDARIAVTIGKDRDTEELGRGRRFLIDDEDSAEVLAYQITKPNRMFNVYNDEGVFRYILNEVNLTDNDNVKERIADYYNWKPKTVLDSDHIDSDTSLEEIIEENKGSDPQDDDKEVWF